MSGGPIPFTAIHDYCIIYGIEDYFEFSDYINKLDRILMEHQSKKARANDN